MERFIRPMAPGWFAAVMGTAVTSLAFTLMAKAAPSFALAGLAADLFHYLAIVLMAVLGVAALIRVVRYPDAVLATIRHPVEGSFYVTFPLAMLVMAAEWTVYGVSTAAIAPLWWVGALGTLLVTQNLGNLFCITD